jgi:hypothetical protein
VNPLADAAWLDCPGAGGLSLIEGTQTLRNVCRDFPEWHRGRSPYVFWALDVDISAVRVQVKGASEHLSGLLLNSYCRQPHVTLDLCGFPSSAPNDDDEFNHALIDRQCSALRAAHVPAFDMFVGGLGSFSSAPFLQVTDRAGELQRCAIASPWMAGIACLAVMCRM